MKNFYKRGMLIIMFLLAMALLVMLAMGQAKAATPSTPIYFYQQEITGKVSEPKGEPLEGVTVFIKNKRVGEVTAADGSYAIQASQGDTLIFSFIGFKSKEVAVGNQSTFIYKIF